MGRGVCVAFAAAWMAASSLPAFAGKVSCEGFELAYDGEAKAKACESSDHSGNDKQYEVKSLDVVDQTFELWVIHFHTGAGTIVHRRTADHLLAETDIFTHVRRLGVSRFIKGFDVVAFNGVVKGTNYERACGFFSRYFGMDTTYGPTDFRNLIIGVYCAEPGFLSPQQEKSGFYDVVEQVIGKLRLPPMAE